MGNYVTVAEVKAEGATPPAARITMRILKWEAIVEEITRNIFRVISPGELIFDGNNSDMLHLSLPLVAVSSLQLNNGTTDLDSDEYRVYANRQRPQDDRHNPKIELTGNRSNSLFTRNHGIFYKGMDQRLTATWGFVDDDPDTPGSYITPPAVKAAIIELVCMDLDGYFDTASANIPLSSVRRERTDGHETEYQNVADVQPTWSMIPQSIATVLSLYRCTWKMSSPDSRRFAYNASISGSGVWPLIVGF